MSDISNQKIEHGKWWAFLLMGVLLILFGVLLIMYPITSFSIFAMFFAIGFFISGIFEIIFSLGNKEVIHSWGWYLVGGIIDLLLGIILIFSPLILTMEILVLFVAFWLLFRGINVIGISIETRKISSDWAFLLILGILEVLISCGIVFFPPIGIGTIIIWASTMAILLGIVNLYIGFRVKKFLKHF